jgi:transcriptional regulator with XRE-family HTH domain
LGRGGGPLAQSVIQHSGSHGPAGAITGFLLKLARTSAGLSQEAFAELLGISLDTVQGWESGRRPLPATRVSALVDVRHELVAANADADLAAALDPAMQADWLIGQTLEPSRRVHPLAEWVITRRVHDLLVWALVEQRPGWLPQPPNGRRRGPVPDGPELGASERQEVFARLRDLAERADGRRESGLQLRRQAAYLAGFDPAPDTSAWLDHLPKARLVPGNWSPEWVAERSRAVIAAARGDPEPLRWFIDHDLADERLESAQLAWNAHYYEELGAPQRSDTFMIADLPAWRGERMLAWLAGRLDPACGYVDLMAHTLWALLASRHYLAVSRAADGLAARVESLSEADVVSTRSRRELGEVHYLLRALAPKGSG